jgi:4-diphosphocytidyl-2-C-methyl-D-erythritol kinase
MQSVALYDTITIRATKGEIKLTTNSLLIPTDNTNIVYKAAEYLKTKYSVKDGAVIHIEKNIPIAAGLAGGSTDAATTLKLLNKAWDLKLTKSELLDAGKKLGADVPFCINGGTALAEGLGDKLTMLGDMPDCYVLLAKPAAGLSTKLVYESLNLNEINMRPDINKIITAIQNKDINIISQNLCNVLEVASIKLLPEIQQIKQRLLENGALGSIMSGSGPTVFGIFKDKSLAYNAYEAVKDMVTDIFVVKTVNGGYQ